MLFVTDVDLGPGHTVLDRVQLPPGNGTASPPFRPMSIVANGRPSQLLLSSCCQKRQFGMLVKFLPEIFGGCSNAQNTH